MLQKEAVQVVCPLSGEFMATVFLVKRRMGEQMSCYKLKTAEQLCCLPTLQKRKRGYIYQSTPEGRSNDKILSKRCLFYSVNSSSVSASPSLINGGTRYQFCCLPFGLGPPPPFYLPSLKTNCSLPMKTVIMQEGIALQGLTAAPGNSKVTGGVKGKCIPISPWWPLQLTT